MADLTKTTLMRDSSVTATSNNGAVSQTIVLSGQDEKMALRVANTDAATVTVTIKAGDGIRSVLGDLSGTVVPSTGVKYFGPFDSMRFKDLSDGKVTVELSGATTVSLVKLEVVELP